MPSIANVFDAVPSGDRVVVPLFVPGSRAPFAFIIVVSSCPALRSAQPDLAGLTRPGLVRPATPDNRLTIR